MTSSLQRNNSHTPLLKDDVEDEIIEVDSSNDSHYDEADEFDDMILREKLERKLLWKLDKRMSILVVIYILNFIDRNNAGAARLRGFEDDLHLKGQQFATVLSVLYIGYISMQVPSNMFLNHIGKPSLYLPACMAVWGFVSLMTGFATNFYGVLVTRFLLGILEASFFPGALFLISKWYKHRELGRRTAILFCGGIISNAFGALIASGILDRMEGVLGMAAWRWLFFVEGGLTIVVALCAMIVLPDFPETQKPGWLSEREIRLANKRIEEDSGHSADSKMSKTALLKSGFWEAMKDGNVFLLALTQTGQIVTVSFTVYFPTLAATLGYDRTTTLLICAPPFLVSAALAFLVSRHSDQTGERFKHIAIPFCVGIIGFTIPLFTTNITWRYISLFLMAQVYPGIAVLFGWISNTFPSPPAKRAVALAFINSVSQIGAVCGSYVWPSSWGPTYHNSYVICICAAIGTVTCCYILRRRLAALNRKLARAELERGATEPGFRYLI